MKKIISCGFIVFRKNQNLEFLVVHSKNYNFWGFPRGMNEKGERIIDTALRELKEETGLSEEDIEIIEDFLGSEEYKYYWDGEEIYKTVYLFLAKLRNNRKIIVDNEEQDDYRWVNYKEAMKILKYDTDKNLLRRAMKFLGDCCDK